MSRNFIFSAREHGNSARNLNLCCGSDASKRSFGAYRDLVTFGHGHLPGARYDDLGIRRHGLLQGLKCYDVGTGRHSLTHDTGHRGFITPKYELRSRANCDYSVSVLLNGAAHCDFAAQNSSKFSSDTYCGSSASTYLWRSSGVSACLQRVGANLDVHSRRDPSANARLRRSSSTSARLQRLSDRSARATCPYCRFGANPDARLRYGSGADYFKNSGGISTRNFKNLTRSLEAEPAQSFKNQNLAQGFSQNGRSVKSNSELGFSQSIKNSERNLPLSFLQSAKNSDQSQNSKHASAQSHAEPNSVQDFLQSAKNSDRNSKANSMQNQAEPVSPQELKNPEPRPAQRQELGFYAPQFKDERARNFFSHPMRAFVLCACFFATLGALSFLAPDTLAIDYVGAHKFYFLFLAPSCIYAAFLLTALPDWTNFEGSLKPISLAFAACLIAAFIASFLNLRLAAAITALFWAVFFIFAAWLSWLDRNSNNFSILAVLAAFCACSAAYGASADEKFLLSFVHINVAAIAVVSYRISVVIGNEALREGGLKDAVFIPNFIYKNLAAFLAFALALATPFLSEATCGFIALGIGFLFLAKLRELHYVEILSRHYMAFYYALQAACAAGYAWLGWELIRGEYAAAPLHVIAICYMYGAILFVGMIAGQRHSGISPLNFPRLSRAALVLALLAGALRAVFAGESFVLYVMIPSALFIAAVALYLINFIPIFLKNPFSADPD